MKKQRNLLHDSEQPDKRMGRGRGAWKHFLILSALTMLRLKRSVALFTLNYLAITLKKKKSKKK